MEVSNHKFLIKNNEFEFALSVLLLEMTFHNLAGCLTQIIDDDAFPGNKHREEIEKGEDAIWNISGFSLFWEFFRLNFIRDLDGITSIACDTVRLLC